MIEATASAIVPAPPAEVFAVVSDIDHADWLPGVRGIHHCGGPRRGVGARFEVEAGMVGRHLRGVLRVVRVVEPEYLELVLEDGLDLTIGAQLEQRRGGCELSLSARYAVGGALGGAVERASQGAARREVARAVEQLASRFTRVSPPPPPP